MKAYIAGNVAATTARRRTTHLTDEQLGSFRQLILDNRADVRHEITELRRRIEEDKDRASDDLDHLHHVDEVDHTTQSDLINRSQRRWEALGDALDRIDAGTYGICKVTGRPISIERLKAIPETELSYEAELKAEKK